MPIFILKVQQHSIAIAPARNLWINYGWEEISFVEEDEEGGFKNFITPILFIILRRFRYLEDSEHLDIFSVHRKFTGQKQSRREKSATRWHREFFASLSSQSSFDFWVNQPLTPFPPSSIISFFSVPYHLHVALKLCACPDHAENPRKFKCFTTFECIPKRFSHRPIGHPLVDPGCYKSFGWGV